MRLMALLKTDKRKSNIVKLILCMLFEFILVVVRFKEGLLHSISTTSMSGIFVLMAEHS